MKLKFVLLLVSCRCVLAFPLSTPTSIDVPLIVISISLFLLVVAFLAIKLVYMKHRRMGTIHAPSSPSDVNKPGNRLRGLLVGCLGSPAWETNLTSKLDGVWRRERRRTSSRALAYQLHTRSKSSAGSRLTTSTAFASYASHADLLVLPSLPVSSAPSRVTLHVGSRTSRAHLALHRHVNMISHDDHFRYGDFGELHGVRSPGGVSSATRRASPCSIRLVDGPSQSNHVEYAFLTALPPSAIARSPLMGTRDSFQLSRCSMKCRGRPAPPLPSLPSFLPFHLPPEGGESVESRPRSLQAREYLPPLQFSPLASVAKVFHSQHRTQKVSSGRVPDSDEGVYARIPTASSSKAHTIGSPRSRTLPIRNVVTKSVHKRSQSCRDLAADGVMVLAPEADGVEPTQTGVVRTPSGSITTKKLLRSCMRHASVSTPLVGSPGSMHTPSMSEISTQTYGTRQSMGDQASIQTPISDDDIGMLGLDRFRWNDEIKELKVRSLHMKKDSVALVPLWE